MSIWDRNVDYLHAHEMSAAVKDDVRTAIPLLLRADALFALETEYFLRDDIVRLERERDGE